MRSRKLFSSSGEYGVSPKAAKVKSAAATLPHSRQKP
jgi:hypothetical protein